MAAADLLSYDDLKSAMALWLNRGDLTAMIPAFVRLAEAEIGRTVRRKTIRASISISSESTTLPANCAEVRSIVPKTTNVQTDFPLISATALILAEKRVVYTTAGKPRYYEVVNGSELLVVPTPDAAYTHEIQYFAKLDGLGAQNQTNYLFAENPDVYLYGALLAAAPYLKNDERVALWQGFFDRAVAQINQVRQDEESNGSLQPARLPVTF